MELGAIYNSLTAPNCTTAIILASQESQSMQSNIKCLFSSPMMHCYAGVLDYRLQCGVPASPVDAPATAKANGSRLDESGEEEVDDSNPFASIVSEGENSGEEEEGESTEHRYTKQQEIFIQEAMSRRTTHSHHCKYTERLHHHSQSPPPGRIITLYRYAYTACVISFSILSPHV